MNDKAFCVHCGTEIKGIGYTCCSAASFETRELVAAPLATQSAIEVVTKCNQLTPAPDSCKAPESAPSAPADPTEMTDAQYENYIYGSDRARWPLQGEPTVATEPTTPEELKWMHKFYWVLMATGEGAACRVVQGMNIIRELHDFSCCCGNSDTCTDEARIGAIEDLKDKDQWGTDESGNLFQWSFDHECGHVCITRVDHMPTPNAPESDTRGEVTAEAIRAKFLYPGGVWASLAVERASNLLLREENERLTGEVESARAGGRRLQEESTILVTTINMTYRVQKDLTDRAEKAESELAAFLEAADKSASGREYFDAGGLIKAFIDEQEKLRAELATLRASASSETKEVETRWRVINKYVRTDFCEVMKSEAEALAWFNKPYNTNFIRVERLDTTVTTIAERPTATNPEKAERSQG